MACACGKKNNALAWQVVFPATGQSETFDTRPAAVAAGKASGGPYKLKAVAKR